MSLAPLLNVVEEKIVVQMTDVEWWRAFDQCTADKIVEKMKENAVAMDTRKRSLWKEISCLAYEFCFDTATPGIRMHS